MKKTWYIVFGLLAAGFFLILLCLANVETRKSNHKIEMLHLASKTAIENSMSGTSLTDLRFPSKPLYIDKNECILVAIVSAGDSVEKRCLKFDIFLEWENQAWHAQIIKVKPWPDNRPATRKPPW